MIYLYGFIAGVICWGLGYYSCWRFNTKAKIAEEIVEEITQDNNEEITKARIYASPFKEIKDASVLGDKFRHRIIGYRQFLDELEKLIETYEKNLNVSTDIKVTTALFNTKLEMLNKDIDNYVEEYKGQIVVEDTFFLY